MSWPEKIIVTVFVGSALTICGCAVILLVGLTVHILTNGVCS